MLRFTSRYRIALPFPLLDSFPRHLMRAASPAHSVGIRCALSTTTEVGDRIKAMKNVISRAITLDERENLSNTLGEICDAYAEGWDSGSDSADDED